MSTDYSLNVKYRSSFERMDMHDSTRECAAYEKREGERGLLKYIVWVQPRVSARMSSAISA